MTYGEAVALIGAQERRISKVNNVRFVEDGYEYRLTYKGGFAAYVGIDRRAVGKRRFEYFGGVGAYNCWSVEEVMDLVMKEVKKKA